MFTCAACNEENPDRARFCLACGVALPDPLTADHETRRTVTVVFCDVVGSTTLGERLDPEALRGVMTRFAAEMERLAERHGGRSGELMGDGLMSVFGVPVAHEDDALRAVRAAAEMGAAVEQMNTALRAELDVEGITFLPLAEVVQQLTHGGDGPASVLAGAGDAEVPTADSPWPNCRSSSVPWPCLVRPPPSRPMPTRPCTGVPEPAGAGQDLPRPRPAGRRSGREQAERAIVQLGSSGDDATATHRDLRVLATQSTGGGSGDPG